MHAFTNILVDVDATAGAHPALEEAVRIAQSSGATLTIVDVIAVPAIAHRFMPAGVEAAIVRDREERLARLAAGVQDVRAEAKLLHGRASTVIVQEVLRNSHDLVVRAHTRDAAAPKPKPFGVVDMELLRTCPCPVLLARHGNPAPHPHVAAAVNATVDEAGEEQLNVKIIEFAALMAELSSARATTVLHAWAPYAEHAVRMHATPEQHAAYVENARQLAAENLEQLMKPLADGPAAQMHTALRRGEVEEVIPEFVVAEGVDLLVIGTVARTGITGFVIGNTAERLLRKLPCSVLAVKPDGFVSPVQA